MPFFSGYYHPGLALATGSQTRKQAKPAAKFFLGTQNMANDVYQPCPCGSGKKYKFCCYAKMRSADPATGSGPLANAACFPVDKAFVNTDWKEQGLAQIAVTRRMPGYEYLLGVYLVDVFCLGLKDTFYETRLDDGELRGFLARFPQPLVEFPYEDARSVVLGAIEYARNLSFEPQEGWKDTRTIIEDGRPFAGKFTFGENGKPLYIQGPNDDAKGILAKLEPLLKKGKAHFVEQAEDGDFDEDDSFWIRYTDIARLFDEMSLETALGKIKELDHDFPGGASPHS